MAQPYVRGMVEKTEAQPAKHLMRGQHDQSQQYECFAACACKACSTWVVSVNFITFLNRLHEPLCSFMIQALLLSKPSRGASIKQRRVHRTCNNS
jgi:hypothetical protein